MPDSLRDDDAPGSSLCLEVVEGRSKGQIFPLTPRSYVVGRLPGVDIRLADAGVSRRHLRVYVGADDSIEIEDMRSTNGVFLNGRRIERCKLALGDVLTLGPDACLRLARRTSVQATRADVTPVLVDRSITRFDAHPTLSAVEFGDATDVIVLRRPKVDELPISARQLEVSRLVAPGLPNAGIAERLGISVRTVTSHLDHIYGRLGISSRAALTRWIVERGLLEPET